MIMKIPNWQNLNHATIVVGREILENLLSEIESILQFATKGNPDFLQREYATFGIDEARELVAWVSGKPLLSDRKLALLTTPGITLEAQNALLKTLEEPPFGTYIIFCLPNVGSLLPTLLSRVSILEFGESSKKDKSSNEAARFLGSHIGERLNQIKALAKKEDKTEMKNLIRDLEQVAYTANFEDKTLNNAKIMKKFLTAKVFAASRGASPKMLLEWLAML